MAPKAIILTEYFDQGQEALRVLDLAEKEFGTSSILKEQRSNVLYHSKDDMAVLDIWQELASNPHSRATLDPFAYRRAGVSAARLNRWGEAAEIFNSGAESIQPGPLAPTKFGLRVDAAHSLSLDGNQIDAIQILAEAILELLEESANEDDARWEAVLRIAVAVCRSIESLAWNTTRDELEFEPGYGSSPDSIMSQTTKGQAARNEMTRVQILEVALSLIKDPNKFVSEIEILEKSRYFMVRLFATKARLAMVYSTKPGANFIEALLAFDTAMADISARRIREASMLEPDDGPDPNIKSSPDRWFGLLCAGAICSGAELIERLKSWLETSNKLLGSDAALSKNVQLLLEGASRANDILITTIRDTKSPPPLRCGAAAQLLNEHLNAEKTIQLQAFLISALMRDDSFLVQKIFNRHVARKFAEPWHVHVENSFQFYSPRISIPQIKQTLENIEKGSYTLRSLLVAASSGLNHNLGDFIGRVL